MPNSGYVSCIKIAGCPILPPLITDERRLELRKYREAAIEVERKLARRAELNAVVSDCDDSDTRSVSTRNDSSNDSFNTTVQLIEFIKKALNDVSQNEEVQYLQKQIMEELYKFEHNPVKFGSCDTLNNIDTISCQDDKSLEFSVNDNNFSESDAVINEQGIPSPIESSGNTPKRLIRKNSYTLESPSPSILTYLKSLAPDEQLYSEIRPEVKNKSYVSRNLNKVWSSEPSPLKNELDNSEMSDSCALDHNWDLALQLNDIKDRNKENIPCLKDTNENTVPMNEIVVDKVPKTKMVDKTPCKIEEAVIVIQSYVRGFLVRRLLKTARVIELKNTIKDSLVYALALHTEETISTADVNLHIRLIRQATYPTYLTIQDVCRYALSSFSVSKDLVTSACYELYSIFFEWSTKDKMNLICQDRIKMRAAAKMQRAQLIRASSRSSNSPQMLSPTSKSSNDTPRSKTSTVSKSSLKSGSSVKFQPWK